MRYNKHQYILFFLFLSLLLGACNQGDQQQLSKDERELNAMFELLPVPDINKDSLIRQIEVYRNNHPSLSAKAHYIFYSALSEYYSTTKMDKRRALLYADSAISTLGHNSDKYDELAKALFTKADILIDLGSYNEAFDLFFQSKKFIDKVNNNCTSNKYSYRIAMVLYKQRKFVDARYFFKKGLAELLSCDDNRYVNTLRIQEYYNNIALSFTKTNQLDSAVIWYKKGLAFIESKTLEASTAKSFFSAKAVIYGNLGGVLIQQGNFKQGEKLLLKSIEINDKPKVNREDAITAKFKLINGYIGENRILDAKKYIDQIDTSSVLQNIEHELIFLRLKTQFFIAKGDENRALASLTKANEIRDSLQKHLDGITAIDLSDRFNYLSVEQKVDDLEQERDFQKKLLIIVAVLVLASVGKLMLIYFFWNKSRKTSKSREQLNLEMINQNSQLEKTLTDLEVSDREKDGILRTVAHDLRNPIAGIATMIDLMAEEERGDDDKYKFQLLKGASGNALSLINDLMEATESKNTLNTSNKTLEEFVSLTRHIVEFLSFKAKEKQQELIFQSTLTDIKIAINRDKITRVLGNLIANAIKFSPNHKLIKVEISTTENYVVVKVIDQGIGIADEIKKEVFMIFTSAKRFGTNGEKSHGLGLSICKQIVESHNGKIWVEDNPDGGSIFSFTLPIA